jgi:hypothetical protein
MSDETSAPDEGDVNSEARGSGVDGDRDDFLTRILDQIVDLAQTARDWVRQEAEATVKEKIVPPLQKLGLAIASAFAAASLLVLGLIFVAVAAIVALSQWLGVPWAFFTIGAVYLIGAGVFTAVKVRSMQR